MCRVGVEPTIPYSVSNRNQLADFTTQAIKGYSRNSCSHYKSIVALPASPRSIRGDFTICPPTHIFLKKPVCGTQRLRELHPLPRTFETLPNRSLLLFGLVLYFCRANLRCYWSLPQIVQATYAVFGDSSEKHTLPYVG